MSELAVYEHAREALAAAVSFDEVTKLHGDAQKAKAYARIAKDRKLQADATEIVARAERKLGILLRKVKDDGLLSQGGRPTNSNVAEPETGAEGEPVFDNTAMGGAADRPFTLAEIGIDKKLSSRAQKLAALEEDDFESAVQESREKILSAAAPVVSPPKPKPVKAEKPAPIAPLPPRKWHQFAFSVLALSLSSDRVSSDAVQKLAEFCGIAALDGETVDFTPEAIEAMGSLATVALKALDGEEHDERYTQDRPAAAEPSAAPARDAAADGRPVEATAEQPPSAPLSTAEADAIIRGAYEGNTTGGPLVGLLAAQIGRPGKAGKAYVRNRARVMGLSSRDNQRAAASAFATAQHAARREGEGQP